MLEVESLEVSYGGLRALSRVSVSVGPGEFVALVGANGAGKSTLLHAIARVLPASSGAIRWAGESLLPLRAHEVVARGIATVPEGRRLFPQMTVEENLELGAFARHARAEARTTLEQVYALLPRLRERRRLLAGALSGGEQQMVAIGRALMARPRLLLLDEPSLGLAPAIVDTIFEALTEINTRGTALLLVEQNVQAALGVSGRAYVLEGGQIVGDGKSAALLRDPRVREAYLGPLSEPLEGPAIGRVAGGA